GNLRSVPQILKDVARAMKDKGLGSGQQLAMLTKIFGERAAAGLSELIDQSGAGGLDKYLEIVRDNAGAAAKVAKIMADNMAGDLNQLTSAWADLRIELFEGSESPLRGMAQSITRVIGR